MTSRAAIVESIALGRLTPAPWNPRLIKDHRFKNLCQSIEADPDFLWHRPIVATADGTIYGGNMRFRAVQHLGWESVPAVMEDIPEQLAKERALRDNAGWGEYVDQDLAELLYELKEAGSNLDLLGFESDELDRLLESVSGPEQLAGEDTADLEPPEDPVTQPGDLWLLGEHRLLCGDSTNLTDVERLMGGRKADLLFTDPPYGVAYQTKLSSDEAAARHRRTDGLEVANDDLTPEQTRTLVRDALVSAYAVLEPGAVFYVCTPSGDLELQFRLALIDADLAMREQIVWVKDVFVMGRQDYHWRHETILYGWKAGAGHYFVNDRTQDTVWEITRPKRSKEHPTMKPIELVERAIKNSSRRGNLVLDLFGGSGSTLVAAEQTGRTAYLCEIDPRYVDVIIRRYETLTGKTAVLDRAEALV